jgi:peptidyl-dipeptidase Dcp
MTTVQLTVEDIHIRTEVIPGDLGYIVHRHGVIYADEFDFGVTFETYVAKGVHEFYESYTPTEDRVWICEHEGKIIGSLFLQHREHNTAQLRYFYIEKNYRGFGLGKLLMNKFMGFYKECNYSTSYLWTTKELEKAASIYKKHGFKLTEEKSSNSFGKKLTECKYELYKF